MDTTSSTLAAALLFAVSVPALAGEIEINHPIGEAQNLRSTGATITLQGHLGNGGPGDVDYYAFNAQAGDVLDVDIDGAYGMGQSVYTVIAIFGPGPEYAMLRYADRSDSIDEGSASWRDPRIDKFVVPATGRYTVGVSNFGRSFMPGGEARMGYVMEGDYILHISGVSPSTKQAAIDVKPGNNNVAPLNPKSRGKVPVAILSGPDFEAMNVDPDTLTFGRTGTENSLSKCNWVGKDVNGDGRVDRLCHFENQAMGFKVGDTEGIMRGQTTDGMAFEGRGYLKVVPRDRE